MSTVWILETGGDPLGTLRSFLRYMWQELHLDGMLVPLNGQMISATPQILEDPRQLNKVNPFKPLMTLNAARMMPDLVKERTDAYLGAILRPCEMRALIEMVKHDTFNFDRLLTVCIDCLGTLPADEYQWRAERKGAPDALTQEALQFARQGGIVPYRYRSACQMCFSPEARGADLDINVLGLPVRQYMLLNVSNKGVAERLRLDKITSGKAGPSLIAQRERSMAKLVERRGRARERVAHSLSGSLPASIDEVVAILDGCGDCQVCMDACPICAVDFPQRGEDGRYRARDVVRWLVSCDGCGMCEQVCPEQRPLSAIFGTMREQLAKTAGYTPGYSIEEPLPVA